jgi:Zinc carboxypeptidase
MSAFEQNHYLCARGTNWQIIADYAYGTSHDWAYEQAGIPLTYTIELPGGGLGGFNPPASLIAPTNAECWEAYKVFAANLPASRN